MNLPRCVVMSIYREYRAVINMFRPRARIVKLDHLNVVMATSSSPIKLIVGGRARLVRLASSHHEAIRGNNVCNPRARIMVRL